MRKVYGYDEINGETQLNKKEKDIILEIFERFEKGEKYYSIIRNFNDSGITTENGKKWSADRIKNILTNEIYTGNEIFQKLIEYDKYLQNKEKVMQIAKDNSIKYNREQVRDTYVFTSKLVCGKCVSFLHKQGKYFICSKRSEVPHDKNAYRNINVDNLETECIQLFLQLQSNKNYLFNNFEETKQKNKIKNLDRKIKYAISEDRNIEVIKNLINEKTEATYILYSQFINTTEIIIYKLKDTENIKKLNKKFYRELIKKIICCADNTYEFHFINKALIKVKDGKILKG